MNYDVIIFTVFVCVIVLFVLAYALGSLIDQEDDDA